MSTTDQAKIRESRQPKTDILTTEPRSQCCAIVAKLNRKILIDSQKNLEVRYHYKLSVVFQVNKLFKNIKQLSGGLIVMMMADSLFHQILTGFFIDSILSAILVSFCLSD